MEYRHLHVTMISASDLEKVRDHLPMHPYVVAYLLNDQGHIEGQRSTPAHRKGGTSPCWNHALDPPFVVDVAAALDGRLTLKLEIKTERTIKNHKDVGWVDVPVGELLEQGGDGKPKAMSYAVLLPQSGGTGGFLEFSYKFGEWAPYRPPVNQQPPMARRRSVGRRIIEAVCSGVSDAVVGVVGAAMSN